MRHNWVRKSLLLIAILLLLLMNYAGVWRFANAQPVLGFSAEYRNFAKSNNYVDFPPKYGDPVETGLIHPNTPWMPMPISLQKPSPEIQRNDWYKTPCCLVRIDPPVQSVSIKLPSGLTITGIGLSFYMTDSVPGTGTWPAELNGGLLGDPYYFTAHWEARINVNSSAAPFPSVAMESDDDSWLFLDGNLKIDLGGTHGATPSSPISLSPGIHTVDIFYAERAATAADFKVAFFQANQVEFLDSSEVSAKKSFEDLLRHQAVSITSFGDLLENEIHAHGYTNSTPEFLESLENLTREQEGLLESFGNMITAETPQPIMNGSAVVGYNMSRLLPAEFISLLDSFEDLLHRQYDIKEGFMDTFNETKNNLPPGNFSMFLFSAEELLRSDALLLEKFETLENNLSSIGTVTADTRNHFLESYEQLLENQSTLVEKFEHLIEGYYLLNGDVSLDQQTGVGQASGLNMTVAAVPTESPVITSTSPTLVTTIPISSQQGPLTASMGITIAVVVIIVLVAAPALLVRRRK